ncbi:MAG: TPM domain-containing protein [Bacteroidales bacterium]|nr:TPM domain-containing protein [Bacteroidales bacterium]
MKANRFFSEEQQQAIVTATMHAEHCTSGEIRVHIEPICQTDPMTRAVKVFDRLKMYDTAARNGVLIYLAFESKACAIIGDIAINEVTPANFWDEILSQMKSAFASGDFVGGIVNAIEAVGKALSEFFSYQEDDINELPDTISFGGEDNE